MRIEHDPLTVTAEQEENEIVSTIDELEDPIKRIIDQLREEIDKGQISLIIGEDASGRIPTLIVASVINNIYKSKGFKIPQIKFIAGSRNIAGMTEWYMRDKKDKIRKLIEQIPNNGDRVLIVTDTIVSGSSVEPIASVLDTLGKEKIIATIGTEDIKGADEDRKRRIGAGRVVSGGLATPVIYQNKDLSGVRKEPWQLHAHFYEMV